MKQKTAHRRMLLISATLFSAVTASPQNLPELPVPQGLVAQKSQQQAYVMARLTQAAKELSSGYPGNCPVPPAREAPSNFYPLLAPADVIGVWCRAQRFKSVYVLGAVNNPGAYALGERRTFSTIEAVARAGGSAPLAAFKEASVVRVLAGSRDPVEIPVDLRRILSRKMPDFVLNADDILFIPAK